MLAIRTGAITGVVLLHVAVVVEDSVAVEPIVVRAHLPLVRKTKVSQLTYL